MQSAFPYGTVPARLSYISVTAASAVVLITAAAVCLIVAVITCENKNKDDEKNPVAVASVTKKHSFYPLSHLPLHHM